MTACQTFYWTNEKRTCEKNFDLQLPILHLSTHRQVTTKNTENYDNIADKEEKARVRIKRVKLFNLLPIM